MQQLMPLKPIDKVNHSLIGIQYDLKQIQRDIEEIKSILKILNLKCIKPEPEEVKVTKMDVEPETGWRFGIF